MNFPPPPLPLQPMLRGKPRATGPTVNAESFFFSPFHRGSCTSVCLGLLTAGHLCCGHQNLHLRMLLLGDTNVSPRPRFRRPVCCAKAAGLAWLFAELAQETEGHSRRCLPCHPAFHQSSRVLANPSRTRVRDKRWLSHLNLIDDCRSISYSLGVIQPHLNLDLGSQFRDLVGLESGYSAPCRRE